MPLWMFHRWTNGMPAQGIPHNCDLFPYVGITQIRFRVETSSVSSQPADCQLPSCVFKHLNHIFCYYKRSFERFQWFILHCARLRKNLKQVLNISVCFFFLFWFLFSFSKLFLTLILSCYSLLRFFLSLLNRLTYRLQNLRLRRLFLLKRPLLPESCRNIVQAAIRIIMQARA